MINQIERENEIGEDGIMDEDINLRYYYELESSESFETNYYEFLVKVEENEARYKNLEGSYIDPDSVSDIKKISFYNHLTYFLKHQEKKYENVYEFLPPSEAPMTKWEENSEFDEKKITVIQDDKTLFRLTSDQFGFSAAEMIYGSDKSPLAKLLRLSQNEDQEKRKEIKKLITQYVKNTRTVGGAFLWPVPPKGEGTRQCYYNRGRGQYLEDRVDLTLLEIKYALDGRPDNEEYTSDILYNHKRKNEYMKTWLEHFGTFKKYVEYFMLEPFVKDGMPINIIDGEPLKEDYIKEYREKYKRQHLQNLNVEEICAMLKNLESMILKRSKRMENVIKPYYEKNHG